MSQTRKMTTYSENTVWIITITNKHNIITAITAMTLYSYKELSRKFNIQQILKISN